MPPFIAAATENPLTWASAILGLCGAISYLSKLLLQRTDKAHADEIVRMIASHAEMIAQQDRAHVEALAGKDAINAVTQMRCEEWEQRANRYEALVIRTADAAREAAQVAHVVTDAVVKRGRTP